MSRIGKLPIVVPNGVTVTIADGMVIVKGPKGELKQEVSSVIKVNLDGDVVTCVPTADTSEAKAKWGLYRVLISNMVTGVSVGFSKELEIIGVGYRAEMKGKDLLISVGYSNPVDFPSREGIVYSVPAPTRILISGIDKQAVGQVAADIRSIRPPEPYKGKGIRYLGEEVRRKAGKTGAK